MARPRMIELMAALALACATDCRWLQPGPSDQDVVAAVKKSPPGPPTIGPTYLTQVEAVEVREHGRYNSDGQYWPALVRVKGAVKIRPTNPFQFGLLSDHTKEAPTPVDFLVQARLAKDDFGNWRASYHYDPQGPRWRLDEAESSPSAHQ